MEPAHALLSTETGAPRGVRHARAPVRRRAAAGSGPRCRHWSSATSSRARGGHGRHRRCRQSARLRPHRSIRRADCTYRRGEGCDGGRARHSGDQLRNLRLRLDGLFDALEGIAAENAQQEYYLPDLVAIYRSRAGVGVETVTVRTPMEIRGINSRIELAAVSRIVRETKNTELMAAGVTHRGSRDDLHRPRRRRSAPTRSSIPVCRSKARTTIGTGCEIHSGARIVDSRLGDRVAC